MKINKIYNESNVSTIDKMLDNSIDLILTSPPYDDLRNYESEFDIELLSKGFFRILKEDSFLIWNVFDQKKEGYTGNSMRQALKFIEAGFKLHQYLIYEKNSVAFNAKKDGDLYTNIFEFVFIFSKGNKNVNLICDKKNKYAGCSSYDGKVKEVSEYSPRTSIWKYVTSENDKTNHPAVMPEKLCADLIYSYSSENDLVYDPFMGSGTTAKMAHIYKRNWIGSELSKEYVDLANKRLYPYLSQISIFDQL
jgi:DNA modification methylase